MHILIPPWFYGYDPLMYLASSLVGFLLSFYFQKIYTLSSDKKHMYLHMGFLLFSIGLLSLAVANAYSYIAFTGCRPSCDLGLLDNVFSLEDFSYFMYFGLLMFAYILFTFAYKPAGFKFSKYYALVFIIYLLLVVLFLPASGGSVVWHSYYEYFNLTSFVMLLFISFRNIANYIEKRTASSMFVVLSFGSISFSHLLHIFSFVGGWAYVLAHIFLLLGFGLLLVMVLVVEET